MVATAYKITVKPDGFGFVLVNEASGGVCGDRMLIGEDAEHKKQLWPFKGPDWMRYEDKGEAEAAASKLQTYLDARTSGKTKKNK